MIDSIWRKMLQELDEFIGFPFLGLISLGLTLISLIVLTMFLAVLLPLDLYLDVYRSAVGVTAMTFLFVAGVAGWLTFVLWAIGELKTA